jgi:hypothetical protein
MIKVFSILFIQTLFHVELGQFISLTLYAVMITCFKFQVRLSTFNNYSFILVRSLLSYLLFSFTFLPSFLSLLFRY